VASRPMHRQQPFGGVSGRIHISSTALKGRSRRSEAEAAAALVWLCWLNGGKNITINYKSSRLYQGCVDENVNSEVDSTSGRSEHLNR